MHTEYGELDDSDYKLGCFCEFFHDASFFLSNSSFENELRLDNLHNVLKEGFEIRQGWLVLAYSYPISRGSLHVAHPSHARPTLRRLCVRCGFLWMLCLHSLSLNSLTISRVMTLFRHQIFKFCSRFAFKFGSLQHHRWGIWEEGNPTRNFVALLMIFRRFSRIPKVFACGAKKPLFLLCLGRGKNMDVRVSSIILEPYGLR